MNKKILAMTLLIPVILVAVFAMSMANPQISSDFDQPLSYHGVACVHKIDGKTGEVTDVGCNHNLITVAGINMIKQTLNSSGAIVDYNLTNLSIGGNSSVLLNGVYVLPNQFNGSEGLTAVSARYYTINSSAGNTSLTWEWTSAGAATYIVNCTGISNTTGANTLFAAAGFPSVSLVGSNGDKLNITYYYWIS